MNESRACFNLIMAKAFEIRFDNSLVKGLFHDRLKEQLLEEAFLLAQIRFG